MRLMTDTANHPRPGEGEGVEDSSTHIIWVSSNSTTLRKWRAGGPTSEKAKRPAAPQVTKASHGDNSSDDCSVVSSERAKAGHIIWDTSASNGQETSDQRSSSSSSCKDSGGSGPVSDSGGSGGGSRQPARRHIRVRLTSGSSSDSSSRKDNSAAASPEGSVGPAATRTPAIKVTKAGSDDSSSFKDSADSGPEGSNEQTYRRGGMGSSKSAGSSQKDSAGASWADTEPPASNTGVTTMDGGGSSISGRSSSSYTSLRPARQGKPRAGHGHATQADACEQLRHSGAEAAPVKTKRLRKTQRNRIQRILRFVQGQIDQDPDKDHLAELWFPEWLTPKRREEIRKELEEYQDVARARDRALERMT